jgi:hypothetical protein
MWPKTLSWVALFCSAAAVLFNVGWLVAALMHAPQAGSVIARGVALVLAAAFISSGPVAAIFTVVFCSPIARRYRYATARPALR